MPARLPRKHFKPSWRGDRPAAIRALGRKAKRQHRDLAIDINFQWVWIDPFDRAKGGRARAMHWTTPKRNNYRWILERNGKCRRMTRTELNQPVSRWKDAEVARWRRTRNPHSERPNGYGGLVRLAVQNRVIIAAELKSPDFARDVAARYLVNAARAAGHPAWFMALINMKNCRGKCEAIERNGGQFAVIFGRFRRLARKPPADWSDWNPKPTRLWGPAKWSLR
jgi:hypothetical protein